ncbi:MAG: toll/interleukin-1 receptor domain-containing protein [Pyrinomonadaceae bacterium]
MVKPLIFISHSAKDETARKVLFRLYRRLSRKFEVLLDKERLRGSDFWRRELHTWMRLCHGAVVILSKDAVENSPWVKREATILGFRREADENFVLIPILLPPVTHEDLTMGDFAPLALNEIQMAEGESVDAVVDIVIKRLEPLCERLSNLTALQKVESVLASLLLEVENKDHTVLLRAAAVLGESLKWKSDGKYSAQLARELLSSEFERMMEVLLLLAPYFDDREKVVRVLKQLAPFWVNPDAVAQLPHMHKRPRGQRTVIVNGIEHPFTGRCYIQRACCGTYDWVFANITEQVGYEETPEIQIKLIEDDIRKQILPQIGLDEEDEGGLIDLDEDFDEREKEEPFFILAPKDIDDSILERLRGRYESFTFFLLGEGHTKRPDVIRLEPALKKGRDKEAFKLYRETKGRIARTR